MLPCPRLFCLICLERGQSRCNRPLPSGWPEAHIDLVEPAFGGRSGQRGHQRLRQSRVIGAGRERSSPIGRFLARAVVNNDQVEVRARIQPPRPERAHAQNDSAPPRSRAVFPGELPHHMRPECRDACLGEIGILPTRLFGINQSTQVMDTDSKLPLALPDPRTIQTRLVIRALGQNRSGHLFQRLAARPL